MRKLLGTLLLLLPFLAAIAISSGFGGWPVLAGWLVLLVALGCLLVGLHLTERK